MNRFLEGIIEEYTLLIIIMIHILNRMNLIFICVDLSLISLLNNNHIIDKFWFIFILDFWKIISLIIPFELTCV